MKQRDLLEQQEMEEQRKVEKVCDQSCPHNDSR